MGRPRPRPASPAGSSTPSATPADSGPPSSDPGSGGTSTRLFPRAKRVLSRPSPPSRPPTPLGRRLSSSTARLSRPPSPLALLRALGKTLAATLLATTLDLPSLAVLG